MSCCALWWYDDGCVTDCVGPQEGSGSLVNLQNVTRGCTLLGTPKGRSQAAGTAAKRSSDTGLCHGHAAGGQTATSWVQVQHYLKVAFVLESCTHRLGKFHSSQDS